MIGLLKLFDEMSSIYIDKKIIQFFYRNPKRADRPKGLPFGTTALLNPALLASRSEAG